MKHVAVVASRHREAVDYLWKLAGLLDERGVPVSARRSPGIERLVLADDLRVYALTPDANTWRGLAVDLVVLVDVPLCRNAQLALAGRPGSASMSALDDAVIAREILELLA